MEKKNETVAQRILGLFERKPMFEMASSLDEAQKYIRGRQEEYRVHLCRCILGEGNNSLGGWKETVTRQLYECLNIWIRAEKKAKPLDVEWVKDILIFFKIGTVHEFISECKTQKDTYKDLNEAKGFNYDNISKSYTNFVEDLITYRNATIKKDEFDKKIVMEKLSKFLVCCWKGIEYKFNKPIKKKNVVTKTQKNH